MKDLTIEQKAKRYDEAKYIMKEYLESGNAGVIAENTIKKAFPELAESDDERIRKDLIIYLRSILSNKKYGDKFIEDWISWLEKQERKHADSYCQENCKGFQETGKCFSDGECKAKREAEQKTAWSEEDENAIQVLKNIVRHSNEIDENIYTNPLKEKLYDWLKSLKDRVQPKQEWSEEDENNILFLTTFIEECFKGKEKITLCGDTMCANFTKEDVIERLKSLRPQSQWEPSEEQLKSLKEVIDVGHFTSYPNALEILYEQLKKLREE